MDENSITRIWHSTAEMAAMLRTPGKSTVIVTHVNPDGDAIGSSLALRKLLINLGHQCMVITPNGLPSFLQWLPGADQIVRVTESSPDASLGVQQAEIIFALDFNDLKRARDIGPIIQKASAYKVLMDHHPGPDGFADCILSDTSASSTAELLYRVVMETGFGAFIDKDIATCLFAGIMTDTGCFSFNSSNRATWETVAALLDYGISKDLIYYRIYDNYSADRMRLLGYCLNHNMTVLPEYHTAYITLSREDMRHYNFQTGDSEGFVNYPLSIKGIRFSVLFIEKEDRIRISFRSRGNFSVNEFARKHFQGGGHNNASGGDSFLSLDDTVARFRQLLPEYGKDLADYEE